MQSFNLIISIHEHGKLDSHYNEELSCLEHFKLKEFLLKRTKNVNTSFVSKRLVQEMASSEPVAYAAIIKRLKRKGLGTRFDG